MNMFHNNQGGSAGNLAGGGSVRLLRLRQIIGPDGLLPVSKSTWWAWTKDKVAPQPVKFGRITFWKASEVEAFIRHIGGDGSTTDKLKITPS